MLRKYTKREIKETIRDGHATDITKLNFTKLKGNYDTAFSLADIAKNLIDEMAGTMNCPSNWRDIGEELAEEYQGDDWVMENCKLYEYETIPQF